MAGLKPMRTEFGICQRLESCVLKLRAIKYPMLFASKVMTPTPQVLFDGKENEKKKLRRKFAVFE